MRHGVAGEEGWRCRAYQGIEEVGPGEDDDDGVGADGPVVQVRRVEHEARVHAEARRLQQQRRAVGGEGWVRVESRQRMPSIRSIIIIVSSLKT